MKEKHIYQALKYLYDNNSDEHITEDKLKSSVTDIHPIDYKELRNLLILEELISSTSNNGSWKITTKGINYLIKNPSKIKRDIDIIKICTITGAVIAFLSLIVALTQLYYQINPAKTETKQLEP